MRVRVASGVLLGSPSIRGNTLPVECGFIQHVGEGGEQWQGKKDTGYLYKAFRRCWRMRALRDGARTQGGACPRPADVLHSTWTRKD